MYCDLVYIHCTPFCIQTSQSSPVIHSKSIIVPSLVYLYYLTPRRCLAIPYCKYVHCRLQSSLVSTSSLLRWPVSSPVSTLLGCLISFLNYWGCGSLRGALIAASLGVRSQSLHPRTSGTPWECWPSGPIIIHSFFYNLQDPIATHRDSFEWQLLNMLSTFFTLFSIQYQD